MSEKAHQVWSNQYRELFAHYIAHPFTLGPHASQMQHDDPKHALFTLARYKFCAKMLIGKRRLLELGCGDGFGVPLVRQEVKPESITCIDFDAAVVENNRLRFRNMPEVTFLAQDFTAAPLEGAFDGAYSIDVLEHIEPEEEARFMENVASVLTMDGVFIVGTPNKCAAQYASPESNATHFNLKDVRELRDLMRRYFSNVFVFSMNDEVVHTGYAPMAHFLFALGAGPIPRG